MVVACLFASLFIIKTQFESCPLSSWVESQHIDEKVAVNVCLCVYSGVLCKVY